MRDYSGVKNDIRDVKRLSGKTTLDPAPDSLPPFAPLTSARARLGESPVWSPLHGAYWWVDIIGRTLFRTAPDGTTQGWATPEHPGFVQCIGPEVFVGMESGIFAFAPATGLFALRAPLPTGGMRFNDACTDPQGRIWAGTMDLENRRDNGVLYLFDPAAGSLAPQLDGFRTVNGLTWDTARARLFLSDSHPSVQTVWTCGIGPDGQYWIAGVGGATLYRFAPDGALAGSHAVPVASPTKPAFGPDGAIVLTSFADDALGGRLLLSSGPNRPSTRKKEDP